MWSMRRFLRLGQIVENRAGRANGGGIRVGEAKTFERGRAEMLGERFVGRVLGERPRSGGA